jgi:hypothetical protein
LPGEGGGFGASAFGTSFGAGDGGAWFWALLEGVHRTVEQEMACGSCNRVRGRQLLGGVAPFGWSQAAGSLLVAVSDITGPVTCYELLLEGAHAELRLALALHEAPMHGFTPTSVPSEFADTLPDGAQTVNKWLRAVPPPLSVGEYGITFVDRCGGTATALGTLTVLSDGLVGP